MCMCGCECVYVYRLNADICSSQGLVLSSTETYLLPPCLPIIPDWAWLQHTPAPPWPRSSMQICDSQPDYMFGWVHCWALDVTLKLCQHFKFTNILYFWDFKTFIYLYKWNYMGMDWLGWAYIPINTAHCKLKMHCCIWATKSTGSHKSSWVCLQLGKAIELKLIL